MKVEIFKLIIENINKLNPLDFVIIFLFFVLVAFDCYLFFRWIYRDVIEAQNKSLRIKNGIISDLEKKSTLIEQQRQIIEAQTNLVSNYATSLESELTRVHHEKNKTEEELNLVRVNAFTLEYMINLLLLAKSVLRMIESVRNFVLGTMILGEKNEIPKNRKALVHFYRLMEIETRVMQAISTVDNVIPYDPTEAMQKLSSSIFPISPELRKFDFESVRQEVKEIFEEDKKPYLEILNGSDKPPQS